MSNADGVLPDQVIRDRRSTSWLIFFDLQPAIGTAGLQQWLQAATQAVNTLAATTVQGEQVASVATAIGPSLLPKGGIGPDVTPTGLATPPPLPSGASAANHDVLFYVLSTSDAAVAAFLRSVTTAQVTGVTIERGYQRADGREVFGQRDGLRNIAPNLREEVAFIDTGGQPYEPGWTVGGSYLAYMKIRQNVQAWSALTSDQQAQILGRSADGTRLDLPDGTPASAEGPFTGPTPPTSSHVRKAGPRGPELDPVAIFRRGTPYIEASGGHLEEGLQFVSFQASWDQFTTIFQRWMMNAGFPIAGTGVDALLDPNRNLVTITQAGFYFTLPHDDRYLGAGLFDADTRNTSYILIRKQVLDQSGAPDPTASLEGATFQATNASGQPIGGPFTTDAAGRARSGPLPTGQSLTITETTPPNGCQPSGPQPVTLDCHPAVLNWTNQRTAPPGQY